MIDQTQQSLTALWFDMGLMWLVLLSQGLCFTFILHKLIKADRVFVKSLNILFDMKLQELKEVKKIVGDFKNKA